MLASATPSIETRVNAEQGRYGWLKLARALRRARACRTLPRSTCAAKVRRAGAGSRRGWSAGIEAGLAAGEQALLFLNRRGYAPLTLCRACGHRFQCPNCSAWLVEHRFRKALVCHHCGHVEARPDICPACQEADSLTACGPGVERVAEEAEALFPNARAACPVLGHARRPRAHARRIGRRGARRLRHHHRHAARRQGPQFSGADAGRASSTPTSASPTAIRARPSARSSCCGRRRAARDAAKSPGARCCRPTSPSIPSSPRCCPATSSASTPTETEQRRRGGLPPFGRLAALIVSGEDRGAAEAHARALGADGACACRPARGWRLAPIGGRAEPGEISLLGPAEAPIAVLRGRHRFRLAVKAPRRRRPAGLSARSARGRSAAARRRAGHSGRRPAEFHVKPRKFAPHPC